MAARRRRIPTPPPPRAPKIGPFRLAPMRSAESVQLDERVSPNGEQWPPFLRWDRFMAQFVWLQGQHLTSIGPTGSGKTVLNRELLKRRDYVVVLGVKNQDPELYGPFEKMGYKLQHSFEPQPPEDAPESLVLYVPRTDKQGTERRQIIGRRFRLVLQEVLRIGRWCVYCDDVQYMSDKLRLAPELEDLWQLGRSEKATLVVSSQEPVDIPVEAYSAATHLFLFSNPDQVRAERMGKLAGMNRKMVEEIVLSMPPHEFLYINKNTRQMIRSRVLLRGR